MSRARQTSGDRVAKRSARAQLTARAIALTALAPAFPDMSAEIVIAAVRQVSMAMPACEIARASSPIRNRVALPTVIALAKRDGKAWRVRESAVVVTGVWDARRHVSVKMGPIAIRWTDRARAHLVTKANIAIFPVLA